MRSPLAEKQRAELIEAMLPSVPFDGWSRPALRSAARRVGMPADEALALFPNGAAELVACFSRWADLRMLDRLETAAIEPSRISNRIALAVATRLEILAPWREAVRRALSVLALPRHAPLGLRLLYETVDAVWYGPAIALPFSAFIPSAARLPRSTPPPCFIGSMTARRTSSTPARFSSAGSRRWRRSARRVSGSQRRWKACLTRFVCCASSASDGGSDA